MITINAKSLRFDNQEPIPGQEIELELAVVARKLEQPPPTYSGPGSDFGPGTSGANSHKPPPPTFQILKTMKVYVIRKTNALGEINFEIDTDKEFNELQSYLLTEIEEVELGIGGDVVGTLSFKSIYPCFHEDDEIPIYAQLPNEGYNLTKDSSDSAVLLFDFDRCMIGHVSSDMAKVWYQYYCKLPTSHYLELLVSSPNRERIFPVQLENSINGFSSKFAQHKVLTIPNLLPDTRYSYEFSLHPATITTTTRRNPPLIIDNNSTESLTRRLSLPSGERTRIPITLCRGSFKTDKQTTSSLKFLFGSCHKPTYNKYADRERAEVMSRWALLDQSLADNNDFMLLIGDQIYGDKIEEEYSKFNWFDRFVATYNSYFKFPEVRNTLGKIPTYHIFDDHEIDDDWGVDHTGSGSDDVPITDDQISAGLASYHIFQHLKNPAPDSPDIFDYHFYKAKSAFYVLDNRSQRFLTTGDENYPILGREQWTRIEQWAYSDETQNCDFIFLVSPGPVAFLPADYLREVRRHLKKLKKPVKYFLGGLAGALGGLSPLFGIPPSAGSVLAILGANHGFKKANQRIFDGIDAKDYRDTWHYAPNQKDTDRLLNLLFRLGNDIQTDGMAGPRKRAVVILGGDVHMGALHTIQADTLLHPELRRNPVIYQLTSSSISRAPASKWTPLLLDLFKYEGEGSLISKVSPIYEEGLDSNLYQAPSITDIDFNKLITAQEINITSVNGALPLTHQTASHFYAKVVDQLLDRTIGNIKISPVGLGGRRYYLTFELLGNKGKIVESMDIDLDSDIVKVNEDKRLVAKPGREDIFRPRF